ncbi:mitochondrial PPR repeat protein Ppr1 [Schizosaccharomyces pombe]|uniref:Pentatricopeptide repeat-containing protein 1, mitochondrial n=1 Tax=Schizosaccharomyces pombe (strain 972 / ATCC 24843) TaxID=284812 RepID=PPR1_SCHPO|nr:PPR repeat-containing protein Ppr1 [Schizosaccharomyces pombe]O94368.1 RecName: Full=Pentatricopeptide repeat-containing protein 1, mitochondrial; Flags: Precursor [Schizosaccharomyces pombe 972h-]CAA22335.1 mitochondrial PPR repeat protein Ppr1 [Schizosaccharomyces pombe]|eukprot:NP_596638.1 PPR repeat-containing protein Ppr1 [Schizosaccharomyces pombe]
MLKRAHYVALHVTLNHNGLSYQRVFSCLTQFPMLRHSSTAAKNNVSMISKFQAPEDKFFPSFSLKSMPKQSSHMSASLLNSLNTSMKKSFSRKKYREAVSLFRKNLWKYEESWIRNQDFIDCCIIACSAYEKLCQPLRIKKTFIILSQLCPKLPAELCRVFLSYATGCVNYGHNVALTCFENSPKELIDYNYWLSWLSFSKSSPVVLWLTFTRISSAGLSPNAETFEILLVAFASQKNFWFFEKTYDLFMQSKLTWRPFTYRVLIESFMKFGNFEEAEKLAYSYVKNKIDSLSSDVFFSAILKFYAVGGDFQGFKKLLSFMTDYNVNFSVSTLNQLLRLNLYHAMDEKISTFSSEHITKLIEQQIKPDLESMLIISEYLNEYKPSPKMRELINWLYSNFHLPKTVSLHFLREVQSLVFRYPLLHSKIHLAISTLKDSGCDWNVGLSYLNWLFVNKRITEAINFFYTITINAGTRPPNELFDVFISNLLKFTSAETTSSAIRKVQSKYPSMCGSSPAIKLILFSKSFSVLQSTSEKIEQLLVSFQRNPSAYSKSFTLALAEWLFSRRLFQSALLYSFKVSDVDDSHFSFRSQILICWCYYRLNDFKSLIQHTNNLLQSNNASLLRRLAATLYRIQIRENNGYKRVLLDRLRKKAILRAFPSRTLNRTEKVKLYNEDAKFRSIFSRVLLHQSHLGNVIS